MSARLATRLLAGSVLLVAMGLLGSAAGEAALAEYTCDGRTATLVGTDEDDVIEGTDGDDVIVALGGRDTVRAGAGDDVVCGGDGGDVLEGGPGADRLFGELGDTTHDDGGLAADLLRGGPGDDHLDPGYDPSARPNRDQLQWSDAPRGVRLDLGDGVTGTSTGFGADTLVLTGSPLLVLTRYGDRVTGSPGLDRIDTGGGADIARTGAGDDEVRSPTGRYRVYLGTGNDDFEGGGAGEVLGQRGDDRISFQLLEGNGFSVRGNQGTDAVDLSASSTTDASRRIVVDASAGRVRLGDRPWGVLAGFERHVLFAPGAGSWVFRGTPGQDHVSSIAGRLLARTFGGNDKIEGHREPDVLDAGAGRDRVHGDMGRDRCLHAEIRRSCEAIG